MGHAIIGDLSFETAAYTARYCLKKITGDKADDHYQGRKPEYVTMSRRPGIGADWYDKHHREVYPSDSVVLRGKEMLPPPFYDKLLEKADPTLFEKIKRERASAAKDLGNHPDSRSGRLLTREFVQNETVKHTLRRSV